MKTNIKNLNKQIRLLENSNLFDKDYYSSSYNIKIDEAVKHYINEGWMHGYNPSELFSTEYYLKVYTDVKQSNVNPLVHYLEHGKIEGREIFSINSISSIKINIDATVLIEKNNKKVLSINGWCFSKNKKEPMVLQMKYKNEIYKEFTCQIRRDDVKEAFLDDNIEKSSLPMCGFDVMIEIPKEVNNVYLISLAEKEVLKKFNLDEIIPRNISPWLVLDDGSLDENGIEKNHYQIASEYIKNNEISLHTQKKLKQVAKNFKYYPKISVIMPVYNVEPIYLREAINSLKEQIYTNWELCIADDASTNNETLEVLNEYEKDARVNIIYRESNGHICNASNDAASIACGDFIVLMDNDDTLAPHAFFEIVRLLQKNPEADIIYSDEDKIDIEGKHFDLHFKPDWSPVLFLGYNYINHLTCIRRSLFEKVGKFRVGFEGAQDYDLLLRVTEHTGNIHHIPKVLYHWRAIPGSTAYKPEEKPIVKSAAYIALKEAIKRRNIDAEVYQPSFAKKLNVPIFQLDWKDVGPSVTILIPTYNQHEILRICIDSIINKTTYKNYSIFVIDNDSNDEETLKYLEKLRKDGIRVERISNDERGFSFSKINNDAVNLVTSELVLLLNNDTEVLEAKWLSRMVGYLGLENIGIVGARLLYPNDTVQHAGVTLGMVDGYIPDHTFSKIPKENPGYFFLAKTSHEVSAVTGACLLTRKQTYKKVGGLDEKKFRISLNDIDFCLKVEKLGLNNIYISESELRHYESLTRSNNDDPVELANFRQKYKNKEDIYYSPNLSNTINYAVDINLHFDYREFIVEPIKVVYFTHNLNFEGAPNILFDIAKAANQIENIKPIIVSPVDGPSRKILEEKGLEVIVLSFFKNKNILHGWKTLKELELVIEELQNFLLKEKVNLVIANVLNSYWVVESAYRLGLPSIWWIHESYDYNLMQRNIDDFAMPICEAAFNKATAVLFVSKGTAKIYSRYNQKNNFHIIHNSINVFDKKLLTNQDKVLAKQNLNIDSNKQMILSLGTVGERKDQETLVNAVEILSKTRNDFICYIVGYRESLAYGKYIYNKIKQLNLESYIKLIPETSEVEKYYKAADIFVLTSFNESYPLTILEAMSFKLPIISTPCFGISEQLRSGINSLIFDFTDFKTLSSQLSLLLTNTDKRKIFGINSYNILRYMQTKEEMYKKHIDLQYRVLELCKNNQMVDYE